MLSGTVLKQFRTYLKSHVGQGWTLENRKSRRSYLTRFSFRYISGGRSTVLLDMDFDPDNQDADNLYPLWAKDMISLEINRIF